MLYKWNPNSMSDLRLAFFTQSNILWITQKLLCILVVHFCLLLSTNSWYRYSVVVLTILYMIIYGIIWTMHLIYQAYTAICIGQMRSKNRFATMIIVGAFLFLVGYEMQVVLLQHNRYYSWFYLPCLIAFLVEIVLCHLVIEFILTRKLNIN